MKKDKGDSEWVAAWEYLRVLGNLLSSHDLKISMLEKVRTSATLEDAALIFEKYKNRPITGFYAISEAAVKIEVALEAIEVLRYFDIEYPAPSDAIKYHFTGMADGK